METTSGSIYTDQDIPLVGHEALRDTMTDLTLDFIGGLIVALYVLFRHNAFMEKHSGNSLLDSPSIVDEIESSGKATPTRNDTTPKTT